MPIHVMILIFPFFIFGISNIAFSVIANCMVNRYVLHVHVKAIN